jgi:hypothetical protein
VRRDVIGYEDVEALVWKLFMICKGVFFCASTNVCMKYLYRASSSASAVDMHSAGVYDGNRSCVT